MSRRNGDRSRHNAQNRHKAKLRERRRELQRTIADPSVKVVSIAKKKAVASEQ
jgi:hypothetical protein